MGGEPARILLNEGNGIAGALQQCLQVRAAPPCADCLGSCRPPPLEIRPSFGIIVECENALRIRHIREIQGCAAGGDLRQRLQQFFQLRFGEVLQAGVHADLRRRPLRKIRGSQFLGRPAQIGDVQRRVVLARDLDQLERVVHAHQTAAKRRQLDREQPIAATEIEQDVVVDKLEGFPDRLHQEPDLFDSNGLAANGSLHLAEQVVSGVAPPDRVPVSMPVPPGRNGLIYGFSSISSLPDQIPDNSDAVDPSVRIGRMAAADFQATIAMPHPGTKTERQAHMASYDAFGLNTGVGWEGSVTDQEGKTASAVGAAAADASNCGPAARQGRMDQVHLFAVCWNEAKMIPYFFRHYNELVDKFFIMDNGSTDGSLEMLSGDERVFVADWKTEGDSVVEQALGLTNQVWKRSRGLAEWVFVVDMDEHLYHPDLRSHLRNCSRNNVTAVEVIGYDMIADAFPTEARPLWQLVTRGIRLETLDKLAIFDPAAIAETNFEVGRHASTPAGRVVWGKRPPVKLLHYKRLGADYVIERNAILSTGLRSRDVSEQHGFHYSMEPETVRAQHAIFMRLARPVPDLPDLSLENELALIRKSGLFQEAWYLTMYPDVAGVGLDPLEHFCLDGWREGRDPNPFFNSRWYLENYGDLTGDVNPLLDYIMVGEGVGRKPARDFDPMEYRGQHGLANDDSPLRHLVLTLWDQLPAGFDPELYLQANPDVSEAGLDAVCHYLKWGKAEGRALRPAGGV